MWLVVAGWVAAALVFASFFMTTMLPLRLLAIASNVAFMTYALLGLVYGDFGRLYPILVLHAALLPLNVTRLRQLRRVIAAVAGATADEEAVRALAPYLRAESHPAGETLFVRGEEAGRLFLVERGTIELAESGTRLERGAIFGEVGLLAPHGRRTATAVCATDCTLLTLTAERTLELCYQDARLAVLLARLVAARVTPAVTPAESGSSAAAGRGT
ncbi:MAG TPA: cyclic nucleotide-binding domain-containing protein [Gaiellaceae bacterium]|nr:cyclic nucleotide-binding domain-containing protein [Gaiellaceae bacterium]